MLFPVFLGKWEGRIILGTNDGNMCWPSGANYSVTFRDKRPVVIDKVMTSIRGDPNTTLVFLIGDIGCRLEHNKLAGAEGNAPSPYGSKPSVPLLYDAPMVDLPGLEPGTRT